MIIAVDEQIPYWEQAFTQLGQVRLFSGRELRPEHIRDVDVLVVRAITPVNADLLDGSTVRFVAGASAGVDQIDQACLRARGIHFGYAAGCNAESVSEYVVTALHIIASRRHWDLKRKSLAVIGVGNVGSRVAKKAVALGMNVLLCDPPLRDLTGDNRYRPMEDVLGADILSFHVPLSSAGPYPTWHMLDRKTLARLSPGQFLINTSRGAIFDSHAVKAALQEKSISGAVLDVWEGEPEIDYSLLELTDIGTPHIAGVALDGKIRATEMVREELSKFFGIQSSPLPDTVYPGEKILYPKQGSSGQEAVTSVLQQGFEIMKKDEKLRALGSLAASQARAAFDQLRNEHPLRLEFSHFIVELGSTHSQLGETLRALGFKTS